MAMSKEYLAYLNQHIEIAPANSQEEVEAASAIEKVLRSQAGLSVEKHDIAGPAEINFVYGVLGVLFFLGMVFSGFGGAFWAIFGFIFAALGFVFLFLRFINRDVLSRILPVGRSQNLVAHHKGYGPHAGRGVRPIVVLAHYDTGKEEFLYNPSISRYSGLLFTVAPFGVAVAAVCILLQLFVGLPEPFLRTVWIIGMLAALPAVVWSINNIAAKFMPLSGAANDNNAGVAALLGVVEDVCVSDPAQRAERRATLLEVAAKEAQEAQKLGLAAFKDVSHSVLPKEKAAETANPVLAKNDLEKTGELKAETAGDASRAPEGAQQEDLASAVTAEIALSDIAEEADKTSNDGTPKATTALPADNTAPAAVAVPDAEERIATASSTEEVAPNRVGAFAEDAQSTPGAIGEETKNAGVSAVGEESTLRKLVEEPRFEAVRHGQAVIEKMGMLPAYCDIEYVEELPSQTEASANGSHEVAEAAAADIFETSASLEEDKDGVQSPLQERPDSSSASSSARRARRRSAAERASLPQTARERAQALLSRIPAPSALKELFSQSGRENQASEQRRKERVRRRSGDAEDRQAFTASQMPEVQTQTVLTEVETIEVQNAPATIEVQDAPAQDLPVTSQEATTERQEASENTKEQDAKATTEAGSIKDSPSAPLTQKEAQKSATETSADTSSRSEEKAESTETAVSQDDAHTVDDPMWGTSSFTPISDGKNVARRAALFDLPDPSVATVDPLSDDFQIQHTGEVNPEDFPAEEFASAEGGTLATKGDDASVNASKQTAQETIVLPNEQKNPGPWKGGAALSEDARGHASTSEALTGDTTEKAAPTESTVAATESTVAEPAREEDILDTDYANLVAHDIWFVVTGASGLDHAGAKAFFEEHKKDLRGACVINLDAVGAGELSVITEEGFGEKKKADRRMVRFLSSISKKLHIPLLREKRAWADSEATFAMRSGLRAVTVMGTDPGQVPALAHTDQNVPENVDDQQVEDANRIVTQLIRDL